MGRLPASQVRSSGRRVASDIPHHRADLLLRVVIPPDARRPIAEILNGDAEAIIALEAVGYVPESAIREAGRRSGLELDTIAVQKIFDLMPWPDWEQRVRRLLRDNVGAEDEDAEVVVTELGGSAERMDE